MKNSFTSVALHAVCVFFVFVVAFLMVVAGSYAFTYGWAGLGWACFVGFAMVVGFVFPAVIHDVCARF